MSHRTPHTTDLVPPVPTQAGGTRAPLRPTREEQLHDVLSATVTELEETNARLRRYAATVAHDLRSPLVTIVGFSELLEERRDLPSDVLVYLAKIRSAGTACADLIETVLTHAQDGDALGLGPVDLGAELVGVGLLMPDDGLDLAAEGTLPMVMGSRAGLRQVLLNLVSNAVKHRRERTPVRVRVSARRVASGWEVVVADDGPGIPAAQREQAFEPGERLASATRGNGLGLASCRRLVEAQGGRVWLGDAPGGGLAVHLRLPALPEA